MPTASEIAQISGNEYASEMLDLTRADAPLFNRLPALPMRGTSFITLAMTALPTAGGILHINQGYLSSKATFSMGKVEAKRFGLMVKAPKSSTDLWDSENTLPNGAMINMDYMTIQAQASMKAELNYIEKCLVYGTGFDPLSFPGLKEVTGVVVASNSYTRTGAPEDYQYLRSAINWGGTTANTASSVYSICEGPQDVAIRMGGPQGVEGFLAMSDIRLSDLADPDDSTRIQPYYIANGEGYAGLQIFGSSEAQASRAFGQYSVRRAFNVTADVGFTCTPALLDLLYESHPAGHKPTCYLMSMRSLRQYRDAMVAAILVNVDANGRRSVEGSTIPLPTQHNGIPIIASEFVYSNEAIETPA